VCERGTREEREQRDQDGEPGAQAPVDTLKHEWGAGFRHRPTVHKRSTP
jgi:hypothetical protein